MSNPIVIDPESDLVTECFAVIYAPGKRRKRFPENCVQVVGSAEEAVELAASSPDRHPARVLGPSRSSEGFRLYYLGYWLD